MTRRLVVLAGYDPLQTVDWRLVDDAKDGVEQGVCLLSDLPREFGTNCILVLPGDRVSTVLASVTARNDRQLRAAAPYAVEDDVGEDLEDIHLAIGTSEPTNGIRAIQVVDHDWLQSWLNALDEARFSALAVYADHSLIAASDTDSYRLDLRERTLVSLGNWTASVDREFGGDLVQSMVLETAARHGLGEDDIQSIKPTIIDPGDPFTFLAHQTFGDEALSLLQGEFERRNGAGDSSIELTRWKWPALLAACVSVFAIGLTAFEGMALRHEAVAMRAETETVFKQAFPEVQRVVNPRAQLRAQLGGRQGDSSDFLALSSMLAQGVDGIEGLDVQSLRFDEQQSELRARIAFSEYSDMTSLKQAIDLIGGRVEEGGSRQSGGRRLGEITVTRR